MIVASEESKPPSVLWRHSA